MKQVQLFLRLFIESVKMALQSLVVNRLRTFLSILSIAIGIFSIIAVKTGVDSMKYNVMKSFDSMNRDVIYIQKWPWIFSDNYPWWKYLSRPKNRYKEAEDLDERLSSNPYVGPVAVMNYINNRSVKYRDNVMSNVSGSAVSYDYPDVNKVKIDRGRFFSYNEAQQGSPVIIIGSNVANNLFGDQEPLNKEIYYFGRKLQVIGVFEKQGKSVFGNSEDDRVMIPINFLRTLINIDRGFGEPHILVKAGENVSLDELEYQIRPAMRAIRKLKPTDEDNFSMNRITVMTDAINSVFDILGMAGNIIGFFAVLVGGFGIANIMFVSVKERTGIIGIQKSLGAKNYFVLFQYLTESVVLCVIGGIVGVIMVYVPAYLIMEFGEVSLHLSFENIIYGNIISIAIGIIAGFIPALQASRLDPVEAIRSKM